MSSGAVGVASWVVVPAGLVSAAAERGVLSALFWVASLLNGTGVAAVEALGSTTWELLGLGASLSSRFSLGTLNGPITGRPADGVFVSPVSAGSLPLPRVTESRGRTAVVGGGAGTVWVGSGVGSGTRVTLRLRGWGGGFQATPSWSTNSAVSSTRCRNRVKTPANGSKSST